MRSVALISLGCAKNRVDAEHLLALRFRHQWGGLIVVLLWSFLISAHVSLDPSGIKAAARDEGCLGDPILFIGLVIAICIATILYTAPLGSRPPHGEN